MEQQLLRPTQLGVVGVLAVIAIYHLIIRYFGKRNPPFPPGPPGEFLLGHHRTVPVDEAFKQYAKWGKEYSMCPCRLNGASRAASRDYPSED